jgi:DNA-binding transcriptional regulator of glucitol operon
MIKWFKSLNRQAKIMLLVIVLLAVCVVTRWQWVKSEVGDALKSRFEQAEHPKSE